MRGGTGCTGGVQGVEGEGGTWPLVRLTNKKLFHICARLVRNAFVFIVVPRDGNAASLVGARERKIEKERE